MAEKDVSSNVYIYTPTSLLPWKYVSNLFALWLSSISILSTYASMWTQL